ncbi:MAG TPA: hypothetical protein VMR49_02535 [Candidatus Paceibacterota bacterium]|nr:hypothetical protein [Candidatus Paceibacterota bacterium]
MNKKSKILIVIIVLLTLIIAVLLYFLLNDKISKNTNKSTSNNVVTDSNLTVFKAKNMPFQFSAPKIWSIFNPADISLPTVLKPELDLNNNLELHDNHIESALLIINKTYLHPIIDVSVHKLSENDSFKKDIFGNDSSDLDNACSSLIGGMAVHGWIKEKKIINNLTYIRCEDIELPAYDDVHYIITDNNYIAFFFFRFKEQGRTLKAVDDYSAYLPDFETMVQSVKF